MNAQDAIATVVLILVVLVIAGIGIHAELTYRRNRG